MSASTTAVDPARSRHRAPPFAPSAKSDLILAVFSQITSGAPAKVSLLFARALNRAHTY
jgi:hypothetical protein